MIEYDLRDVPRFYLYDNGESIIIIYTTVRIYDAFFIDTFNILINISRL